jgi:tRNASer (uridine44-2'-O)-methyltransferase
LRSEVLSESTEGFTASTLALENSRPLKCIHRKLLPRRPGRDAPLEQYCTFYASEGDAVDNLILTPIVPPSGSLPYYHPAVHHIRFRYLAPSPNSENESIATTGTLQIEVDPLPGTPNDPNSRLYRTCLALLETVHRYGWGVMGNYKKRVIHDCVVPREPYQDLYLVMRERHKHLVDTWQEVTDPYKHVFEVSSTPFLSSPPSEVQQDIGIATFLMLLWKDTYKTSSPILESGQSDEFWKTWPRPPGGFVDFGCGNGLLTHILAAEGYAGVGIDVRARTSWSHYPTSTQSSLKVHAFDPLSLEADSEIFKPGAFIIGNHADELTPWVPVVSRLTKASGYISIPCCAWAFDRKFDRARDKPLPYIEEKEGAFVEGLNLGGEGSNASSYSMYRIWLASVNQWCGWTNECEVLRIPSTRNWAVIGESSH